MENCYKEEEISRYLDGELNRNQARLLAEHLEACPVCRETVRRLEETGRVCQSYWRNAIAPSLTRGPDCPEEGILMAFADGSIQEEAKRREISAHLAGCNHCAGIVAGSARATEQAAALGTDKLSPVPAHLNRLVEKRYFSSAPVSLGRINVILSEIEKGISRSRKPPRIVYPLAPSSRRMGMAAEAGEDFPAAVPAELSGREEEAGERETARERIKPLRAAPQSAGTKNLSPSLSWALERGEMNIAVEMAGSGRENVECRINLTDCYGFPLAGVPLRLEKDGKIVWSYRTELKKSAVFSPVTRGRYRLTIDHERDYYLDIDVS